MPPSAAFAKGEMLRASFEEPKAEGLRPGAARGGGFAATSSVPLPASAPRKGAKISPLPLLALSPADGRPFSSFLLSRSETMRQSPAGSRDPAPPRPRGAAAPLTAPVPISGGPCP